MKRILSFLLCVALIFGALPTGAWAAEDETTAEVEAGDITMEGTNSVGNLLVNTIEESQAYASEGCSVRDISVEGNVASVSLQTDRNAVLVVAVYDETTMQMLASANAEVTAEETEKTVEIVAYSMPEHFVTSAFLLDAATLEPLCQQYVSRYYTREFQDFLSTTAEDYDAERVLLLSDDLSTNFMVFGENVILAKEGEGGNAVFKNEDGTVTITDADERFQALQPGESFCYQYQDGTLLIVTAADVTVNGTTVAVLEDADAELSDVFDYVKIDGDSREAEFYIDESVMSDGLTYEGMTTGVSPYARTTETTAEYHCGTSYKIDSELGSGVSLFGEFSYAFAIGLELYLAGDWQYISFGLDYTTMISVGISGEIDTIEYELPGVKAVFYGIVVSFAPSFVLEASAKIEFTYGLTGSIGFVYDSDSGFNDTSALPGKSGVLQIEGEVFFGLRLKPAVSVVTEEIAGVYMAADIGVLITATAVLWEYDSSDCVHDCAVCFDGEISLHAEIKAAFTILDGLVEKEETLAEGDIKLADFYWSLDKLEMGWGTCPYMSYKVSVTLVDEMGLPMANVPIRGAAASGSTPVTKQDGTAEFYLPNGKYVLSVSFGEYSALKQITVQNHTKNVLLCAEKAELLGYGTCGEDAVWRYYDNGKLVISGTGYMSGYFSGKPPWSAYMKSITHLVVEDGIKNVGIRCFADHTKLKSVELAESVTSIEYKAFIGCSALETVDLSHVTSINTYAFQNCTGLTEIELFTGMKSVGESAFAGCTGLVEAKLPGDMTVIPASLFDGCTKLESVRLPEGLVRIGDYAFQGTALREILLPEGLSEIGRNAFQGAGLERIKLPDTVVSVGIGAFASCENLFYAELSDALTAVEDKVFQDCAKLNTLELPAGIVSIGEYAFQGCKALTELWLPDGLESIGVRAFGSCESLGSIHIPAGVTDIPDEAFYSCDALVEIYLPEGLESIGMEAFYNCKALTEIQIPATVSSIGQEAFLGCVSLEEIVIPEGVETLPYSVFYGCDSLVSAELPETLVSIGPKAFYGCDALKEILLPDGVESIGASAFGYCMGLERFELGTGLVSIDSEAFFRANDEMDVYVPSLNDWFEISFADPVASPLQSHGGFYVAGELVTELVIPEGITEIDAMRFYSCGSLTSVVIPEGVTTIGEDAFNYCLGLRCVSIPESVTAIGKYAFYGCSSMTDVYYAGTGEQWESIEISDRNDNLLEATMHYGAESAAEVALTVAELIESAAAPETPAETETLPETEEPAVTEEPVEPAATAEPETEEGAEAPESETEPAAAMPEVQLLAAYTGGTSIDSNGVTTAEFTGLVPGEQYVLVVCLDESAPVSPESLLYIDQRRADENGTVVFEYLPRLLWGYENVRVYGASTADLSQAQFVLETNKNGTGRLLVLYGDEILLEGTDFRLFLSESENGSATVTAIGVGNYAGSCSVDIYGVFYHANGGSGVPVGQVQTVGTALTVTSIVPEKEGCVFLGWSHSKTAETVEYHSEDAYTGTGGTLYAVWEKRLGDVNGDDSINAADLVHLMRYLTGAEKTVVETEADLNNDGRVDILDVIGLVRLLAE